jgi:hypothetical protein
VLLLYRGETPLPRKPLPWRRVASLAIALAACNGELVFGNSSTQPASGGFGSFAAYMTNARDPFIAQYGYGLVDATPSQVSTVGKGQKALVWVGNYDKVNCVWEIVDAQVQYRISTYHLDTSDKVYGYYIADEPDGRRCPNGPRDVAARTALIHRLDPTHPTTYVVLEHPDQYALYAGTADIIGADPYPCHWGAPCDTTKIPNAIAALHAAGIARYWGVLQTFQDSYYRYPTVDELTAMIEQWRASAWSGEQTFAWTWAGNNLADHPELLAVLTRLNTGQ